jgi:hypothetical protein
MEKRKSQLRFFHKDHRQNARGTMHALWASHEKCFSNVQDWWANPKNGGKMCPSSSGRIAMVSRDQGPTHGELWVGSIFSLGNVLFFQKKKLPTFQNISVEIEALTVT